MALGIRGLHKGIKQFLETIEPRGWSFDGHTKKHHIKLRHVSGAFYYMPSTPSDHRGLKNVDRHLARIERGADLEQRGHPRG